MKMNALLLFALFIFSCNENKNESMLAGSPAELRVSKEAAAPLAEASNEYIENQLDASSTAQPAQIDRKLIRNGQLEFKSDEVKKTRLEIDKICKELNAYVSSESENNYGERLQHNQIIRVPAGKFDDLVSRIEALAEKVDSKNIQTDDVTEQFIDLEARLKTKKELEARYLEILKQAKTVEEIMSVENQIGNVRSEIESMEGRLNYLKNQVSYSTLNLTYYETIGTDFGFFSKFFSSLQNGWQNLLSFIIFIFTLWPFAIAIVIAAIWWRRRKKEKSEGN